MHRIVNNKRGGYRSRLITENNQVGADRPCVVLGQDYCEDDDPNNWYAFHTNQASNEMYANHTHIVWRTLIRGINRVLRHQYSFSPLSGSAQITHPCAKMRIYVRGGQDDNSDEARLIDYWKQYMHNNNPVFRDSIDFRLRHNQNLVPEIYPIMQVPTSHDAADQGTQIVGNPSMEPRGVLISGMIPLRIRNYN